MDASPALPRSARLDISTHCQLKCPSCPTASGLIAEQLGAGFTNSAQFEQFIQLNPQIAHVELSNWGEVLLNPDFAAITAIAFRYHVALTIGNGVNLNTAKLDALEALVHNKIRLLTCSIDGASQPTYEQYRKGGNFDRVIANIKAINEFKKKYKSRFPILLWQYVVFNHNKHELEAARSMAKSFDMEFYPKISWDSGLAPAEVNKELYQKQTNKAYMQGYICKQLFSSPQANWDGRLLGCCVNSWGDYGNLCDTPLAELWNGERLSYARRMLLGQVESRADIPCSTCDIYQSMEAHGSYLQPADTKEPLPVRLGLRFGRLGIALANRHWWAERLMEAAIRSVIRSLPKLNA